MTRSMRLVVCSALAALPAIILASPVAAQTSGGSAPAETRPATTTFFGDTGLWFVPTGEVLPDRRISGSAYRASINRVQGFSNIVDVAGTFAVGLKSRVELFGSWRVDRRIDRDVRPTFTANPDAGGLALEAPFMANYWSGDALGDLLLGLKINLLSESRQQPVAFAVRGIVKVPTGDKDKGVATGRPDVQADAIVSKELRQQVEFSVSGGALFRGDPDSPTTIDLPNSARWGIGLGFPSRSALRMTTELHGDMPFASTLTAQAPISAFDGSRSPLTSNVDKLTTATFGLTWQSQRGLFFGVGANLTFPMDKRTELGGSGNRANDYFDYQFRLGYHPGTSIYVPPAPPAPPPPPAPANRPPTVKAMCDPCTVNVGQTSTVTADAQDPDGDPLTYRWSAPTGTFANPAVLKTIWTAPQQEGAVPVTVTVDDGKGGTASDSVTIQVVRPPVIPPLALEDVHFDFDRYTLRPEALRLLDQAVVALKARPTAQIVVEGHTCNIGTAEYNQALGDRRAQAVLTYLVSQGVAAARLRTVSYGEERPKHDNSREETRRLNRRAALVVNVQ